MFTFLFGSTKRTLLTFIAFGLILFGSIKAFQAFFGNGNGNGLQTHTVGTGDIAISVRVAGTATLLNEQKLSFGKEGKISHVNVEAGDQVKVGDVLAELNLDDYHNALNSAELDLANANLALEKMLKNDTSLGQEQLRSKIEDLRANLGIETERYDILISQLETVSNQKTRQLNELESAIALAQSNLAVLTSGYNLQVGTEQEQTLNSLNQYQETLLQSLDTTRDTLNSFFDAIELVDKIFGVTNKYVYTNADIHVYLSAKNSALKSDLFSKVLASYNFISQERTTLDQLNYLSGSDDIVSYLSTLYSGSFLLDDMIDTALDALNESLTSASFSQTSLDSLISSVNAQKSTISSLRSSVQSLRTTVDNLLSVDLQEGSLDTTIQKEALALEEAEINLQNLIQQKKLLDQELQNTKLDNQNQLSKQLAQISNLKNSINLSEQELQDLIDGADSEDIQTQRNRIRQAELALLRIQDQKKDFQIIAEFDGRVRSVDITEGEQYKLDDREFIVIENPNLIELALQVNQIDIVKVKVGDPVTITFDAYPNKVITSSVESIDVNPLINERGGTSYKVTVLIQKQDLDIYAGMTALATILSENKSDIIVVPSLALLEQDGMFFVQTVDKDHQISLSPVEIGITDNFNTEVVSGLSLGTTIVSSVLTQEDFDRMGITTQGSNIFGPSN